MAPTLWLKNSTAAPKHLMLRMHPKDRQGATVLVPFVGLQERSELREHLQYVNHRNPKRKPITEAAFEEALEKRLTGRDRPLSTRQLLMLGLRPGERKRIKDAQERLARYGRLYGLGG